MTHRPGVLLASGIAAFVGGALSSGQSRANGELSHVLQAPVAAALWSFASGWVLLSVALVVSPAMRRGLGRIRHGLSTATLHPWQLLGGLIGGAFIAAQAYAVPQLGVALFTVAVVGGQTANALVVDRFGLGPGGRRPLTLLRLGATGLAFAGVALAAVARQGTAGSHFVVVPVLVVIVAGAALALQAAMNGRVNAAGKNALSTSWINFAWGTGLLAGLVGLMAVRGNLGAQLRTLPPWWALIGGILGVAFVAIGTAVVGYLGVLVMTLLALTGQLMSAVALDLISPTAGARINAQLIAGVAVTLVGGVIAGLSTHRPSLTRRPSLRATAK